MRRCWQLAGLDEDAVNGAAKRDVLRDFDTSLWTMFAMSHPVSRPVGGAASNPTHNIFVVESFIVIAPRIQAVVPGLNHLSGILGLAIWERFEQLSPTQDQHSRGYS